MTATASAPAAQAPRPVADDGRDARDARRRDLELRLVGLQAHDRLWGWLGPLLVMVFGGVLRFWRLDRPDQLVFDETYYVKGAASLLKAGFELRNDSTRTPAPDERFAAGTPDVFDTVADFVVHPPVGKWMIAAGEQLLGVTNPWGWRFAAAVCGTLSLLMVARIGRRLLGSTLLGCTAALLLAVDGQHLVHSRTGLLDVFVMFWGLAAFGCLVVDRDRARARLARLVADGADVRDFGPGLGIRWWRVAAGVCLGLMVGVKWSGLWFVAVFGLMTVLWDVGARRAVGTRQWAAVGLLRDGPVAALQMLPALVVTYLAGWTGWFLSSDGYDRQWAAQNPTTTATFVPDALRSLWHYHGEMWRFHVGLETTHPYMSNPWSWTVLGRPTAFWYQGSKEGVTGCGVADCSQAVLALGNPVLWWGATLSLVVLLALWALRRDWRAGAILAGVAAGWLPWFLFQERTIYTFYAVAFVPWMALALAYVLGLVLGPPTATAERRMVGAAVAGVVVLLAVALAAWFWPIYVAEIIPRVDWSDRMWLPSWI